MIVDRRSGDRFVRACARAGTRRRQVAAVPAARQAPTRLLNVAVLALEVTRFNDVAKRVYSRAGFEDREHHLMTLRLK